MQPIELIETINHSSNLDSKNTRRQTKQLIWGFVCQSSKSSSVIPTSPLSGQLQAGSLSTAFLTSLALASFLSEAKQIFTNFPKTHRTLGSSRAIPSRLEDFTSKSNKCNKDCFTKLKCSSTHKENSLNPPLRFSHKSEDPHQEGLGRAHKGLGWVYFVGSTSNLKRREGERFYTCSPKTSCWKLVSKNWNI
jgi:hypothetical protein